MPKKINLLSAILININIIIGAGVFLNIKPISKIAGPLGYLGYTLGAIILLPFVYSLAKLAEQNPSAGGLYFYSKKFLNPLSGFISGWSYFIGKSVSAAFLVYAFTTFFQKHITLLQFLNPLLLSSILIFILALINILGVQIGGKIQLLFFTAKSIPILAALIFGIISLNPNNFYPTTNILSPISTLPIALYAMMGFEITCSIGHLIKNPKKNIFLAIFGSFLAVSITYILFQALTYGALGQQVLSNGEPLTLLSNTLFLSYPIIGRSITSLVFAAVIGGAFGMLTSNCWNLHTLAANNHLPFKKFLTKTTTKNVPWVSLLIESSIACLMLIISKNLVALQSMSVFGVIIAFILSSLSAFFAAKHKILKISPIIPILAIISCGYVLLLCLQKMHLHGTSIPYLILLFSGIIFYMLKK